MNFQRKQTAVAVLLFVGLYALVMSCGTPVQPSENAAGVDGSVGVEKQSEDASTSKEQAAEPGPEAVIENAAEAEAEQAPEQNPGNESSGTSSRPNILLIILDDYGVDSTKTYGKPNDGRDYAATPNLDSVCKTGVQFQNAWSTPLCSSTRATILTGRHGFRTGIGEAIPRNEGIGIDEPTLPKILDANNTLGYAHANVGKWHLGTSQALGRNDAPNRMGWSHYTGVISGSPASYYKWDHVTNGQKTENTNYATSVTVKDAVSWLEKRDPKKPWLLWLAFNAPHDPLHLPPKELHNVSGLTGTDQDIRQKPNAYFRAMVEALDTEVGNLFTWLKDKKMFDNTVIIFIGDNGTQARAVLSPYDRRRSKGSIYQNGIHVPYCISGPIVEKGGRTSDALVHTVDLFSTILEVAGVDVKNGLTPGFTYDSESLVPLLKDPNAKFSRDWNFSYRFGWGKGLEGNQSFRNTTYKLVRTRDDQGVVTDELFNLKTDPLEEKNILDKPQDQFTPAEKQNYNDLVAQLEALLKTKK